MKVLLCLIAALTCSGCDRDVDESERNGNARTKKRKSKTRTADACESALSTLLLPYSSMPLVVDAATAKARGERISEALASWKKKRDTLGNDDVCKHADRYAATLRQHMAVFVAAKNSPPSPQSPPSTKPGARPGDDKPLTRKEALEAAASAAVDDMLGGYKLSSESSEKIKSSNEAEEAARTKLLDWCLASD